MKYILILMLLSNSVLASEKHRSSRPVTQVTEITNTYNISKNDYKGVAIAIASAQHNFTYGTKSWQGSVGVGFYKEEEGISFSMAKRVGKVLITGSITSDSIGAGVSWRF